jgi:GDP-L-fucose synthase
MGTSCSYPADLPMTEENYLVGLPGKDLYTYAMTKRMLLTGLMAFEKQYGLKWLCFIPSTLYGPGFEEHDNHFIFDLIRKIYNGKNYGDEVELWGDGYQRRELIYVDDAIDAMLNLLNEENQIFNLGSSNDLPIRHYAQEICNSFDYDHDKIFYNIEKYVGVRKRKLEVDKVQELSLNYCNTSLAEGLKKTAQFYSDNYGKNKKE